MPACLEISICFLGEKTSEDSNGSDLALGRPDMRFVLTFVNDGFHLGSTSMEHDFVIYDSKFNFFPLSKKKKDILIELWRNRPQSKNYIEIVSSFIVSIQFLYHLMPFVTLSREIKRLIHSWIINIDFSITQVFILF